MVKAFIVFNTCRKLCASRRTLPLPVHCVLLPTSTAHKFQGDAMGPGDVGVPVAMPSPAPHSSFLSLVVLCSYER